MANIEQLIRREERRHGMQLKRKDALDFRRTFSIHERRAKLIEVKGGHNGIVDEVTQRRRINERSPIRIEIVRPQIQAPTILGCAIDQIQRRETTKFGVEEFRIIGVDYAIVNDNNETVTKRALMFDADLELDRLPLDELEEQLATLVPEIIQTRWCNGTIILCKNEELQEDMLVTLG